MDNIDKMAEAIKGGIDNNASDAPALSIDPDTQQTAIVGDPNKIASTNGNYTIKFVYPADQLSDDDKARMKPSEDNPDEYVAEVTYVGKRVKPLHRTTVAMNIAEMLTKMGVLTDDGGYSTDGLGRRAARVFLDNINVLADVAKTTLDIPEDQLQYMSPDTLVEFFVQMMNNEPNIVKEAASFLEPSLVKQLKELMDIGAMQQPGTQQN